MSKIQLNRLQNDLMKLTSYMEKVRLRGKLDLLSKLDRKQDFLKSKLETSN